MKKEPRLFPSSLSRIGAFGAIPPEAVIRVRDKLQQGSRDFRKNWIPAFAGMTPKRDLTPREVRGLSRVKRGTFFRPLFPFPLPERREGPKLVKIYSLDDERH